MSEEERLVSHIAKNQRVIDFLYRCRENTDNLYKKKAYTKAINEIHSYWHSMEPDNTLYLYGGSSIKRKINEFLEGFPEEDILFS